MGTASATVIPPRDEDLVAQGPSAQQSAMLAWMEAMAPYGIFTTDAGLKIRTWNQWLVAHSGLTAESVIGRPLSELFPDIVTRRLDEYFRRALQGEMSVLSTALHKYLLPLRATMRSGHHLMLQTVRVAPLTAGGATVGTIATIEDVTQREFQAIALRRQQEHDRLLSSALALLLSAENPLQTVTELFPTISAPLKLEVYFNYLVAPNRSELLLHAAGGVRAEARKALAVVKVDGNCLGVVARDRRTVQLRHVQESTDEESRAIRTLGLRCYAGFPLLVGERLLGTLCFGSYERDDIAVDEVEFLRTIAQYLALALDRALRENALRQAQHSLSEHAGDLELKIAERTTRLHETIAQLESFTYTVAHDLRAPIRSLKGYSEILLSDYAQAVPPDGQVIIQRLRRASNRLDALTRDLLAFSKIARQDVQLAPVDVDELLYEIIMLTPGLQAVTSVQTPIGWVFAQSTLLQQCLSNLLDNAVKFATPGTPLRIRVRAETRPAGAEQAGPLPGAAFSPSTLQISPEPIPNLLAGSNANGSEAPVPVRIWIEDNGIGIAGHAHEKIFGIFERVSGLDHVEGTGIGLAIVARAMQQMGGACGVESVLGSGSRFWLELAGAPPPAPQAPLPV